MRIFKNKWVTHWAKKENIPDSDLYRTAVKVVAGKVEADLGGYLFKKRVAREGGGKRTGYRILLGYKKPNVERIIFLYAFAKNARPTISDKEKEALRLVAESFISSTNEQIIFLIKKGTVTEIQNHD
jgi:hypothetical protein